MVSAGVTGFLIEDLAENRAIPGLELGLWYIHIGLAVLVSWSLAKTHLSDPGTLVRGLRAPSGFKNSVTCKVCLSWKPPRAHHSKLLNRCIFRMDHVCRWAGNVIGYSNQKFFILLLAYSCIASVFNSLVCLLCICRVHAFNLLHGLFPAVYFLANVIAFWILRIYLSEQIDFLDSNITLIETFRNCEGRSDDVFKQVFGLNPFLWLIPVYSSLPPDYTEQVFPASRLSDMDARELDIVLTDSSIDLGLKVD